MLFLHLLTIRRIVMNFSFFLFACSFIVIIVCFIFVFCCFFLREDLIGQPKTLCVNQAGLELTENLLLLHLLQEYKD